VLDDSPVYGAVQRLEPVRGQYDRYVSGAVEEPEKADLQAVQGLTDLPPDAGRSSAVVA